MSDRPTLWSDTNIEGIKRYTSYNPKFRLFMIVIGFVLILFFSIYIILKIPSNETSMVRIITNPENVTVLIGDQEKGQTPLTLRLVKDEYLLKFRKKGYKSKSIQVKIQNDSEDFKFDLNQSSVPFSVVSTPAKALIYIDNVFKGSTPLELEDIPFGVHKIRASMPGYQELEKSVDFDSEDTISFDLTLKLFNISIDSDPSGANIFIDEDTAAVTPWKGQLKGGVHQIRLALEGHKMIKTDLEVTSDLDNIVLPFSSKSLSIEAFDGNRPVYGANIYVCLLINNEIHKKIPPLLLGTTQWTGQTNLLTSYITQDQPVQETALVISKNSLKGADIQSISLDKSGQILTKNVKLNFPGYSSTNLLGIPIENIDFQTLNNEKPSKIQLITNYPRFHLSKTNNTFLDRDDPAKNIIQLDKALKIEYDDILVSPDQNFMAHLSKGFVTIYNIQSSNKLITIKANKAVFTNDSKTLLVTIGNTLYKVFLTNLHQQSFQIPLNGFIYPITNSHAVITNDNKNLTLWNFEKNTHVDWSELLNTNKLWVRNFKPTSLFTRYVAGKQIILILGTTFGLGCLVSFDPEPSLLNIWMPENIVTSNTKHP